LVKPKRGPCCGGGGVALPVVGQTLAEFSLEPEPLGIANDWLVATRSDGEGSDDLT
jgi:hypothetical protein